MAELTLRERQLLWVLGERTRSVEPGGFYKALLEAAILADEDNLTRLGTGFPDVARAVRDWRDSPNGWRDRE